MSTKKVQKPVKATTQDIIHFEAFRFEKVSEYFAEKAQSAPEPQKAESQWLSGVFSFAAKLKDAALNARNVDVSASQAMAIVRAGAFMKDLQKKPEGREIDQYVFSRLGEFNRNRWARIEKSRPKLAKLAQQYKPL